MNIETERLTITEFTPGMARVVQENSTDDDNRRFVPDEVWETAEEAEETLKYLISQYGTTDGPLVYPIIVKETKDNIGYVQLCPIDNGKWEIGYHIAKKYTGNGYATEAVKAFLPVIAGQVGISEVYGICLAENKASIAVMRKCGFQNVFSGIGLYQGAEREIIKNVWKVKEERENTVKCIIDDLLYQKYLSNMEPIIPDSLIRKEDFTAMLSSELSGMHAVMLNDACPEEGFLYCDIWTDEVMHCVVPVYGYYAENEKTMVRLFQKLAESAVKDMPCDFSINLYRDDSECINAFHMMQFGTMAEKCLTKLEKTDSEAKCPANVVVLNKKEIVEKWAEIWQITEQLIEHLRKSPVFYPGKEFTESVYREFFLDESVELIAAADHDKIIGIIEWNYEGNELLDRGIRSVNVGEAFVYPEYRGTGLALRLLSAAKARAYLAGARYMWVEHGTANPNARGFWNKYFTTYQYELIRRVEKGK